MRLPLDCGRHLRPGCLLLALASCSLLADAGRAQPASEVTATQITFDSRYLRGSSRELDLARFRPGSLPPGRHHVDVTLNGNWIGSETILFTSDADGVLTACLQQTLLQRLTVILPTDSDDSSPAAGARAEQGADEDRCRAIDDWLPHAEARLDAAELRLDLSVAQTSLQQHARGYVDPIYWDAGIVAGILAYDLIHFQGSGAERSYRSSYLDLESGFNLGTWQWRQAGSLSWQDRSGPRWYNRHAYLRKPLPAWHARFLIGDQVVADPLLDAIRIRGAVLESEESMYPESMRGFAPTIRGMAESNAIVEVRQNGLLLRRFNVAPGPFEIDDIYSIGGGADLQVVVTEADGRVTRTQVPYAFNPLLVRDGALRYRLAAGRVQETAAADPRWLLLGSARYGISNRLTTYASALASADFHTGLLGAALNTRFGAWSLDAASSRGSSGNRQDLDGSRWRLSYAKAFGIGGFAINAAITHYPQPGFGLIRDAVLRADNAGQVLPVSGDVIDAAAAGSSALLSLSVPLTSRTALYANGLREQFDRRFGKRSQYQIGVRSAWRHLSWALAVSQQQSGERNRDDTRVLLSLSLPIGTSSGPLALYASSEWSGRGQAQRFGLSGSVADGKLDYSTSLSRNQGRNSAAASVLHRGPWTTVNGFAESNGRHTRWGFGASGVVIGHADGITFGPQRGETYALVDAKGATGAGIVNAPGSRIDGRGFAISSYLSGYVRNSVEVDLASAEGVEIQGTVRQLVPYAGAVVRARFQTIRVDPVLVDASRSDGSSLPFAAEVLDESDESIGVVGQGGRIYLQRLGPSGRLLVRWGNADDERCWLQYQWNPDAHAANNGIRHYPNKLECVADTP